MKTDQYLRDLQTAQYYAYRALVKNNPQLFNMYKETYKSVTPDYTNKAMRCVRKEREAEFQELYEAEALKRGIKTNYHRRKTAIDKIKAQIALLETDLTKPINIRLI